MTPVKMTGSRRESGRHITRKVHVGSEIVMTFRQLLCTTRRWGAGISPLFASFLLIMCMLPASAFGQTESTQGAETDSSRQRKNVQIKQTETERITDNAHRDWKVSWAHDGKLLSYEALLYDNASVRLIDYRKEESKEIGIDSYIHKDSAAAEYSAGFTWHPDKYHFVGSVTERGDYNLMRFRLASGLRKLIFGADHITSSVINDHAGWQGDVRYFPSGEKICFVDGSSGSGTIKIMPADGGEISVLSDNEGMDYAPDISPDGNTLVYTRRDTSGNTLYIHDFSTDKAARVSGEKNGLAYGVFIDNTTLAAYRGTELVEISLPEKRIRLLAEDVFLEQRPAVHPEGKWIAFIGQRNTEKPLMLLERSSGRVVQLDTGLLYQEMPVWSVDGGSILIEGYDGFQWDLYRVEIPGGDK